MSEEKPYQYWWVRFTSKWSDENGHTMSWDAAKMHEHDDEKMNDQLMKIEAESDGRYIAIPWANGEKNERGIDIMCLSVKRANDIKAGYELALSFDATWQKFYPIFEATRLQQLQNEKNPDLDKV